MMYVEFFITLLELLELLLCGYELSINKVHLLRWGCLIDDLRGFPRCWRFTADIVQRILVVCLKLRMLEFPRLGSSVVEHTPYTYSPLTPEPYGECPLSSLLCRTLWKSYLLSWRTKLAKLLCLKCLGRMDLVNLSFCAGNQRERLMGYLDLLAPRVRQSFRHRHPTARLESTMDPPAFFSCDQHDIDNGDDDDDDDDVHDDGGKDDFSKVRYTCKAFAPGQE